MLSHGSYISHQDDAYAEASSHAQLGHSRAHELGVGRKDKRSTPTGSPHNSCHSIKIMSIVYRELINSTINKLSSSITKSKKPKVALTINGHKIKALYDTGANICCMTAAKFRQVFPVGQRPKKLNVISTVTVASGDQIECLGVYPIPFEIDK
jgi:hypothetical protein